MTKLLKSQTNLMNILVTGSNGFIAKNLIIRLESLKILMY